MPQWYNEITFNSNSPSPSDSPVGTDNQESSDPEGATMSQWIRSRKKKKRLTESESVKETILVELCEKVKKNEQCLMKISSQGHSG